MSRLSANFLLASWLAMPSACDAGLDRTEGAHTGEEQALPARSAPLDASFVSVDAGLDAGASPSADAGLPLGSRPRDRCSPAGEGDFPWAPCDATRGLVCTPPDRRLLDAPSTCQCPASKVFAGGACAAQ